MIPGKLVKVARFVCLLVCLAGIANCVATAQIETWRLDPPHSAAQFSVRHMGISTVRGTFTKVAGELRYSAADPTQSSLDVTIDAASLDTRVEMRDNDLRSAHFLETAKYPTITFKSKRVEVAGAGKLKVTGDLTIHGMTKEVVLDVDGPTAPMKDPRGNEHMGASAALKINRQDFGVGETSAMIGNEVDIQIDVELIKQSATPPPHAGQ
jgi:polyisoprenoid-binding protein YceI